MPIDIDNQQYASVHLENENFSVDKLSLAVEFYKELIKTIGNEKAVLFDSFLEYFIEYIKIDRDKSTFKSHRDFDSEIEMTFKHF